MHKLKGERLLFAILIVVSPLGCRLFVLADELECRRSLEVEVRVLELQGRATFRKKICDRNEVCKSLAKQKLAIGAYHCVPAAVRRTKHCTMISGLSC